VITSTEMARGPEYSVEVRDWKTGDAVAPDSFAFDNSSNAEKIDVAELKDKLGDLPDNFVGGDKK